jgi:hypothetical protein
MRWFGIGVALLASAAIAAPLNWRGAVYRGTFAQRPTVPPVGPAALFVVTDCATTACTAGGATMECIAQNVAKDESETPSWDVIACGTTTTTTTSSTTTTT